MKSRELPLILDGISCEHPNMDECCPDCGHWHCPDCGVSWDDWGEGSPFTNAATGEPVFDWRKVA